MVDSIILQFLLVIWELLKVVLVMVGSYVVTMVACFFIAMAGAAMDRKTGYTASGWSGMPLIAMFFIAPAGSILGACIYVWNVYLQFIFV